MNGLPADTDVSFLVGAELVQVCIGQNEVILHFLPAGDPTGPNPSITIESEVRLVNPDGAEFTLDTPVAIGPALLPLLRVPVTGAFAVPPGTLRLQLSSGHFLDVIDDSEAYESYTVTNGDRVIVV
ncbi:MAG: DUF6188 family protein [Candidatus Limnocylindrales bacterium]|jgi:hypothetical protein